MKFELMFSINDNLMAKYLPTTFRGDALNWYFSLPTKTINCYAQLILEFYIHFKYRALIQVTLSNLTSATQGPK